MDFARWFPKNMGGMDRLRRLTFAAVMIPLAFVGPQTPLALLVAAYPLLTGLFGRCPLCVWLEVDTIEHDEPPSYLPRPLDADVVALPAGRAPSAPVGRAA